MVRPPSEGEAMTDRKEPESVEDVLREWKQECVDRGSLGLWGRIDRIEAALERERAEVRFAVAQFIRSEGCSCCESSDHEEHENMLARLVGAARYDDDSGWDWSPFLRIGADAAARIRAIAGEK